MEPTQTLASASPAIPRQFYCPITRCVMLHPVTAPDGMSYERRAWEDWENSRIGPLRSPITRALLTRGRAVPNEMLRTLILEHPGTTSELDEQRLEERTWKPTRNRNVQIIRLATVSTGAVGSVFCGTLVGVVGGFAVGELASTLDPEHLFGPAVRNYERGMMMAQRGAQVGALYGLTVATRILGGKDTNKYAIERAGRQLVASCIGGLVGGIVGLIVGGLSWPLACFATEMCQVIPFQSQRSIDAARVIGFAGAIVGVTLGIAIASQTLQNQTHRTSVRRGRA